MSERSSDQLTSDHAKKFLERMDAHLREAVDSLISDPRFATHGDLTTVLLAIAETCPTRERALALFKGAVWCIEHGDLQVGRRVRLAEDTARRGGEGSSSGMSMTDALDLVSIEKDWRFLWSRLGDRAFCGEHWNQYVAVFMEEVVGSGATDPEAREAALRTLSQRGIIDVPGDRLVVDFVGDP